MPERKDKCKTCEHWKSEQSELNYRDGKGFCTNKKFHFDSSFGTLIAVFDSNNIPKDHFPIHEIEIKDGFDKMPSRYKLVTEEDFGCIFHQTK